MDAALDPVESRRVVLDEDRGIAAARLDDDPAGVFALFAGGPVELRLSRLATISSRKSRTLCASSALPGATADDEEAALPPVVDCDDDDCFCDGLALLD